MKRKKIIDRFYSKKSLKKINDKILLIGDNCKFSAKEFLNYRTIGSILIFATTLFFTKHGYIWAPLCTIVYNYLLTYILIIKPIKDRIQVMENDAIFFFEILGLTLESGKTLTQGLEVTSKNINSEISKEFLKTLNEVKMGKSLIESLKSMKYRIPSDAVNNTILNITESSIFGSNIIDSLYNQLEYLRNKKIMDVKSKITKLPTKISVISVIFFIPIIMLIILAPVAIDFLLK